MKFKFVFTLVVLLALSLAGTAAQSEPTFAPATSAQTFTMTGSSLSMLFDAPAATGPATVTVASDLSRIEATLFEICDANRAAAAGVGVLALVQLCLLVFAIYVLKQGISLPIHFGFLASQDIETNLSPDPFTPPDNAATVDTPKPATDDVSQSPLKPRTPKARRSAKTVSSTAAKSIAAGKTSALKR